jgi:hypothetical protein
MSVAMTGQAPSAGDVKQLARMAPAWQPDAIRAHRPDIRRVTEQRADADIQAPAAQAGREAA